MSNMLGRCENVDCLQKGCERLNENGAVYDFAKICGDDYKWFEGKKISNEKLIKLEEFDDMGSVG